MTATCLNGDCLELMKTLPDKSIDLFLCDLPYGCLLASGKCSKPDPRTGKNWIGNGCFWDVKIDLVAFWEQVKRLCKNDKTPVLMFCNTRFGNELINSNPSWFRYDIVWNKDRGSGFLTVNRKPMASHEMIYVFSKTGSFYKMIKTDTPDKKGHIRAPQELKNGIYGKKSSSWSVVEDGKRCPLSVIHFKMKQDKRHSTAKPVDLLKWLIERYSNEGDTILEPTAGSFNSGRASVDLGRNYIGMEMDKDFYEKCKIE